HPSAGSFSPKRWETCVGASRKCRTTRSVRPTSGRRFRSCRIRREKPGNCSKSSLGTISSRARTPGRRCRGSAPTQGIARAKRQHSMRAEGSTGKALSVLTMQSRAPSASSWMKRTLSALLVVALVSFGCREQASDAGDAGRGSLVVPQFKSAKGDAGRGAALVREFECNRCHEGTSEPEAALQKDCRGCHSQIESGKLAADPEDLG